MSTLTPCSDVPAGLEETPRRRAAPRTRAHMTGYALTAAMATFTLWLPLGASIEPPGAASLDSAAYGGHPRHVSYGD